MNVNEVISNRANQLLGAVIGSKSPIHPNDRQAAIASGAIDEKRFDEIVNPEKLVGCGVGGS
jgi:fumarate hydratase class II